MKKFLAFVFAGLVAMGSTAWANQEVVRVMVPVPAGGVWDTLARRVSAVVSNELAQTPRADEPAGIQLVIDNKVGGQGALALREMNRKDGSETVLMLGITSWFTANATLDGLRDMTPVYYIGQLPEVMMARHDYKLNTIKDALSTTDRITFACISAGDVANMIIKIAQKPNMACVPYKGGREALADVLGGHVGIMPFGITRAKSMADAKQIKVLGYTGNARHPLFPTVPTLAEQGFDVPSSFKFYFLANKNADPETVKKVVRALDAAIKTPAWAAIQREFALTPDATSANITQHFEQNKAMVNRIMNSK